MGQAKQDRERTARTGLPVHDCQYRTARTGLPGQDYSAGLPRQDSQDMTSGTEKSEQFWL
jgi:hypothetical protein